MTKKTVKPPTPPSRSLVDSLSKDIGARIRSARLDAGWTQAELAKTTSRRQASISAMENGKMEISASMIARTAMALEKPISYFFPAWLVKMLQPEKLGPLEQELVALAKRLETDDLERIIVQVRALIERGDRQYIKWLEEDQTRRQRE